jgi:hypothetical protein
MKLRTFTDLRGQDVVLTSTTNPRFKYLEEQPMKIWYRGEVVEALLRGLSNFHTSYVKSMVIRNGLLEVTTRNSVYIFEFNDKDLWEDSEVITENREELEKEIVETETKFVTRSQGTFSKKYNNNDASCSAPAFTAGGYSFEDNSGYDSGSSSGGE